MEVILKREVPRLGDRGDVVRVADGFARNYLFPKQLAIPATTSSKKNVKDMKAAAEREAALLKGDAQKLANLLQELTIKIIARAGESDQLFGSVTSRDIAAELEKQGYSIDRHKIFLDRPIRLVGDHAVSIHLHRDIDIDLIVKVRAEGRENEEIVPKATAAEAGVEDAETGESEGEEKAAETVEAAAEPAKKGKSASRADRKRASSSKNEEEEEEDEE
ncbi:MAG: 50S ribosomal protein L9 [Bryobacterales bacterium]